MVVVVTIFSMMSLEPLIHKEEVLMPCHSWIETVREP